MTTEATKQNHTKSVPNEKSGSNIYSELYKNSPAKKWLDTKTSRQKICIFCGLVGALVLAIVLPLAIDASRLSPVATREDFIGKTLTDCYVGSEYKGKVDESDELKQEEPAEEAAQKQEAAPAPAPTPTPAPTPVSNKPSIDKITDVCWLYGQTWGVHLTDYASPEITQDGSYYRILMWHNNGGVWKCWYNPDNKDVFVEKMREPWDFGLDSSP